jgi:hypothetical protein
MKTRETTTPVRAFDRAYMARREDSHKSGHSDKIVEYTGSYEGVCPSVGYQSARKCAESFTLCDASCWTRSSMAAANFRLSLHVVHRSSAAPIHRRDLAVIRATPCRPVSVPVSGP